MPVPRYSAPEVRANVSASGLIAQQQANAYQNLSAKMEQWGSFATQEAGKQRAIEAEEQAYKDQMSGKPLHKESVYTIYGQAYNSTRKATYLADTEIDIKNKSNELAIEHKNDPDAYMASMDGYLEGIKKETNIPDIEMALGISSSKVVSNTYNKLATKKQNDDITLQRAKFTQYAGLKSSELINAISSGDLKSADLIRHSLDEYTTSLMTDGVISDSEYITMISDFEFTINKGVAENELNGLLQDGDIAGAKSVVDEFNKEIPKGYTPNQYSKVKASLNKIYNNAYSKIKAEKKIYDTKVKGYLKDGSAVYDAGKIPVNSEELDRLSLTLSEDERKDFELSKQAFGIISEFEELSLPEQQAEVNKLESSEKGSKFSVDIIGKLKKVMSEKTTMSKKDPISLSVAEGLNEPTESISLSNDIATNSDILMKRQQMSGINMSKYGKGADYLLTDEEAKEMTAFITSPTTPIEDILGVINTIETSVPDSSNAVYRQLNKKGAKLFSYVGSIVKQGNNQLATNILMGSRIRKENKGAILTKDIMSDFNAEMGNALRYAGSGQREALIEATLSYAAFKAEEQGELGEYDNGKEALNGVIGGVGTRNDQNYILPFGKTEDDIDDYVDDLTPDMFTNEFQGMSKENAIRVIQDGQLISVGNGKYRVKYMNGFLAEAGNKPFILELK